MASQRSRSQRQRSPASEEAPTRGRSSRRQAAPEPPSRQGSSRRQAASEAPPRRGSSRREAAVAAADRRGSERGTSASERGKSSRRSPSKATKQSSNKRPASNSAKTNQRQSGDRSSRRQRAQPASKGKKILTWSIVGLVVLVGIGLLLTPGILRSMAATKLATAEPAGVDQAALEYLERIDYRGSTIDGFIASRDDAPLTTKLHLAKSAMAGSDGQVRRFDAVLRLALDSELSTSERTQVLHLADQLYSENQHRNSNIPRQLTAWATPEEVPDGERRELALAAIDLMVALHPQQRSALDVQEVLKELANRATSDSLLTEAAIDAIAQLMDHNTIGYGMTLLLGPNADAASRHEALLEAIYTNVRAAHIPHILRLWESPLDRVAALGYRAIGGPQVSLGDDASQQREEIGSRIAGMLSLDLMREAPERFSGLLEAVRSLRLSGTRDQLMRLIPQMTDDMKTQTAQALASFVRTGDEAQQAINEETVSLLAENISDDDRRSTAAEALGMLKVDRGVMALRQALEACVAHAEEAACMNAITHIVSDIYDRDDVIELLGKDPEQWQNYIAKDEPRFTYFREAWDWFIDNQQKVRVSDKDSIPDNLKRLNEVQQKLNSWLDDPQTPVPLGLSKQQIEEFSHRTLQKFKKSLLNSNV